MGQIRWAAALACLLLASTASARDLGDLQIAPERVPIWDPGVEGGIPDTSSWTIVDAQATQGAVGDGVANDRSAIQQAIDQAAAQTVILLPAGTYFVDWGLTLKSHVVLRGEGSESTSVVVRTGARAGDWEDGNFCDYGGVHMCGGPIESPRNITAGATKGSDTLTLDDASGLSVGDFVFIYLTTNDPAYIDRDRGRKYTSYIARVAGIQGSAVQIDRPLRHDMNPANGPSLARMNPIQSAGIENLKLEFAPDSDDKFQPLLMIQRTVNSWVSDVELFRGYRYAIQLIAAARNTIRRSHLHRLIWYEVQTAETWNAYGINFFEGAHDNLMTNNALTDMYIQVNFSGGASGNVFAYNFIRSGQCSHGIFFHGQYPHSNLVEGNDSRCRITLDNFWGRQGPWNTLFRNRVADWSGSGLESKSIRTHADASRIIAPYLNVIGNVTRGFWQQPFCTPPLCHDFDQWTPYLWLERNIYAEALRAVNPQTSTVYLQNVNGRRAPASWNGFRMPASLYLDGPPDFWPAGKPWPAIGADLDEFASTEVVKLPAQEWYESRYPPIDSTGPSPPQLLD